jgi:hypothetical protein
MKQVVQTVLTGHKRDRVMSNDINSEMDPSQPMVYQIRIKGHLGREWTDWFGGLTITLEDNGNTLLTGPVVDQAALYGLLRKVRDVGMPLLSVIEVQFNENHRYQPKKDKRNELKQKDRKNRRSIIHNCDGCRHTKCCFFETYSR